MAKLTVNQHGNVTTNEPGDDVIVCRCEEVTRGEIKGALRSGLCSSSGVKRATRAGMGLCQGQTCQRQVAGIVAAETGKPAKDCEPITSRPPARPVPMAVMARDDVNPDYEPPRDPSEDAHG